MTVINTFINSQKLKTFSLLAEGLKPSAFSSGWAGTFPGLWGWPANSLSKTLNTLSTGLTSQSCCEQWEMTMRNFPFFLSSNQLRYTWHSETCTDLKRMTWGIIPVCTCVACTQIKTQNISSTLDMSLMTPPRLQPTSVVALVGTSITSLPVLELHASEIIWYRLFFWSDFFGWSLYPLILVHLVLRSCSSFFFMAI